MSKPDTFAEVVRMLEAEAAVWPEHARPHQEFLKAARLLAAAGEEVRAGRQHDAAVEEYEYSGKAETGPAYRQSMERMTKARETLNALAPELKENTDGST